VVDVDGKKSFIPASTTKVLTSVAALDTLGPDFTFGTSVGHTGTVTDGTLTGDLVIKGSGDPTLAEYGWDDLFEKWAAIVQAATITKIEGRVIGDSSFYGGQPRPGNWTWKDLGNYYASGAQGLNFFNNTVRIRFLPGKVGAPAKLLGTNPDLSGVTLYNEMLTGSAGSGDQGYVYAAPYTNIVHLRGSVPSGSTFTIKGALPEPALTCAQLFHQRLIKEGIAVSEVASATRLSGKPTPSITTLTEETSAPLSNLLQRMNHKSVNLFAETILNRTGKASGGSGSTASGVAAVNAYFKKHGIITSGFVMNDGAGLSPLNAITPRQMVYFLKAADSDAHAGILRRSLPIAGRTGTLKSVAVGTSAAGRVRAKSGTLSRTKCYAGYVDASSGQRYAFAIMVNGYAKKYSDVKPGIEAIMARMAEL
jgi:D-alanyl-D-alanine carboxypeptidase/D-alanyl-D-alanine-endopeptidase (penicillin-binding protein 4)